VKAEEVVAKWEEDDGVVGAAGMVGDVVDPLPRHRFFCGAFADSGPPGEVFD
jgi:hypothetical protein